MSFQVGMKVKSAERLGRVVTVSGPSQCPVVAVFPNARGDGEHVECFKVDGMPNATYPNPLEMRLQEVKPERWVVISVGCSGAMIAGSPYTCEWGAKSAAEACMVNYPGLSCYVHKLEV